MQSLTDTSCESPHPTRSRSESSRSKSSRPTHSRSAHSRSESPRSTARSRSESPRSTHLRSARSRSESDDFRASQELYSENATIDIFEDCELFQHAVENMQRLQEMAPLGGNLRRTVLPKPFKGPLFPNGVTVGEVLDDDNCFICTLTTDRLSKRRFDSDPDSDSDDMEAFAPLEPLEGPPIGAPFIGDLPGSSILKYRGFGVVLKCREKLSEHGMRMPRRQICHIQKHKGEQLFSTPLNESLQGALINNLLNCGATRFFLRTLGFYRLGESYVQILEHVEFSWREVARKIPKFRLDPAGVTGAILMVLQAIEAAQHYFQFKHHDLHLDNVRFEPHDEPVDVTFVDGSHFVVDCGFIVKISDFEFASSTNQCGVRMGTDLSEKEEDEGPAMDFGEWNNEFQSGYDAQYFLAEVLHYRRHFWGDGFELTWNVDDWHLPLEERRGKFGALYDFCLDLFAVCGGKCSSVRGRPTICSKARISDIVHLFKVSDLPFVTQHHAHVERK
jgi:hypothetical protein